MGEFIEEVASEGKPVAVEVAVELFSNAGLLDILVAHPVVAEEEPQAEHCFNNKPRERAIR